MSANHHDVQTRPYNTWDLGVLAGAYGGVGCESWD